VAEIADMQSRRTGGNRSPSSTYFFQDRPASPAYSTTTPVLTHPAPRSTSLYRKYSDASLTSTTHSGRQSPPPLPVSGLRPSPSLRSLPLSRTPSNSITKSTPGSHPFADQGASHHPLPSSFSVPRSVDSHSHHSNGSAAPTQDSTSKASSVAFPPTAELSRPSTPPKRAYHITNDAVTSSPPPSYAQFSSSSTPKKNIELADKKGGPTHQSSLARTMFSMSPSHKPSKSSDSSRSGHHTHGSTSSGSSHSSPAKSTPQPRTTTLSNRLTALPPRLSLHKSNDSTDLSLWGEALLSGISLATADTTPNTSTFAAAQDAKPLPASAERKQTTSASSDPSSSNSSGATSHVPTARPSPTRHQNQRSRENVPPRLPPPTRPIPPVMVNGRHVNGDRQLTSDSEQGDVPPPSSAWVEPASSARSDPSSDWRRSALERTTPTSPGVSHFLSVLGNMVKADSAREQQTYGAALSESRSPILPISPQTDDQGDAIAGERGDAEANGVDDGKTVGMLSADGIWERHTSRDSSRSSTSTVTVTGFMEPPTIVRNVSVARRAGAYVTKVGMEYERERARGYPAPNGTHTVVSRSSLPAGPSNEAKHPPSPLSSTFGSEDGSASGSGSSSSMSQDQPTPTTDDGTDSPLTYYMDASPDPSRGSFLPSTHHHLLVSATDTFGGVHKEDADTAIYEEEEEEEEEEEDLNAFGAPFARPKIVISGAPGSSGLPTPLPSGTTASPLSPFQRYRGWLSEVVAPLEEFIDEAVDPRDYYLDLQEIAEGESGSVYAARLTDKNLHRLKLPPLLKARDGDDLAKGLTTLVAIKSVAIMPSGSPKLIDLEKELTLMRGLWHDNVLSMDAVYVDLMEDALWIRMELMERSLADLIGLIESGLMLQERMMARFASDVCFSFRVVEYHCSLGITGTTSVRIPRTALDRPSGCPFRQFASQQSRNPKT
jgi:serine/threonine-protein kinase CLA4